MKVQQVKKFIEERLIEKISSYGFKLKKSDGYFFVRKTKFGSQIIGGGVRNYDPEFHTSCSVGIRFDEVEEIYSLIIGTSPRIALQSLTLGKAYSEYLNVNNFSFTIIKEEDVNKWVDEIVLFLDQFGFEFFDKYYSLADLDILFNNDIKHQMAGGFRYDELNRACRGIIIAKLVNNPSYDEIIIKYRKIISEHSLKENFEKVITFLSEYSKE